MGGIGSGVYKRKIRDPVERFMEKVAVDQNGCWNWTGYITKGTGYGQFSSNSKPVPSHRWAYEHFVGEIPSKFNIDHLCRNRKCVNPEHLEAVTSAENTRRGDARFLRKWLSETVTHCKRGHEFTERNTRINKMGHRCCKTCQNMKISEWRSRNRDIINARQSMKYHSRKLEMKNV